MTPYALALKLRGLAGEIDAAFPGRDVDPSEIKDLMGILAGEYIVNHNAPDFKEVISHVHKIIRGCVQVVVLADSRTQQQQAEIYGLISCASSYLADFLSTHFMNKENML